MKFLFKWIFRLALVLVVLLAVLFLSRDWLLKRYTERRITAATGLETRIGKFEESLSRPVLHMENVKLYNRAEFGGSPLVEIRELHVEFDRAAFAQKKVRVTLLRLDVPEFSLVHDRAGRTNVVALGQSLGIGGVGGSGLKFEQIDTLNLTLGKLHYTDLGNPANNRTVNFNLEHQVFQNIRSENDLFGVGLLLLLRCGPELQATVQSALRSATVESAAKAHQVTKQATDEVRGLLKK